MFQARILGTTPAMLTEFSSVPLGIFFDINSNLVPTYLTHYKINFLAFYIEYCELLTVMTYKSWNMNGKLGGSTSLKSCSSIPEDMSKRDSILPRNNGDEARSRNVAVRRGASRDAEGRRRSDASRRTEEAT
jgi:hypothetical protein